MVHLELTSDEGVLLREILDELRSDLRMEIADTDDWKFREDLKRREEFLDQLIGKLGG